jgi:hypothetical protein
MDPKSGGGGGGGRRRRGGRRSGGAAAASAAGGGARSSSSPSSGEDDHGTQAASASDGEHLCFNWEISGRLWCPYGARCRYRHLDTAAAGTVLIPTPHGLMHVRDRTRDGGGAAAVGGELRPVPVPWPVPAPQRIGVASASARHPSALTREGAARLAAHTGRPYYCVEGGVFPGIEGSLVSGLLAIRAADGHALGPSVRSPLTPPCTAWIP